MDGVTVVEHPLVQHKLTLIRDKARSTKSFRELLKEIEAQHVLEMRYVSCWDKTMPGVAGQDAIYVVLKPGVSYNAFRGSYVDLGR